jgi:hypothetical protein
MRVVRMIWLARNVFSGSRVFVVRYVIEAVYHGIVSASSLR